MKAFIAIVFITAAAVAGYLGYRALSKPKLPEPSVTEIQVSPEQSPAANPQVTAAKPATNPATNATVARATANPKSTDKPRPTGEWKAKLDAILGANVNSQTKLQQVKDLLSNLPAEEVEEAVQALARSVGDESFAFLKPLVVDPTLPEPARDEFMVDLMNRPNSIKLPLMLEIARNPDHPDHESAFDNLEAFTGLKLGVDWSGWENGIQQWLKQNPDRPRQPQVPAQEQTIQ